MGSSGINRVHGHAETQLESFGQRGLPLPAERACVHLALSAKLSSVQLTPRTGLYSGLRSVAARRSARRTAWCRCFFMFSFRTTFRESSEGDAFNWQLSFACF